MLRRPVEAARYLSIRYTERLAEAGIEPSVGSVGDSYDNAMVETFFKTIKTINSELIWPVAWQSRQQAKHAAARYIDGFSNPVRRHSSPGFQSPIAFERKAPEVS